MKSYSDKNIICLYIYIDIDVHSIWYNIVIIHKIKRKRNDIKKIQNKEKYR